MLLRGIKKHAYCCAHVIKLTFGYLSLRRIREQNVWSLVNPETNSLSMGSRHLGDDPSSTTVGYMWKTEGCVHLNKYISRKDDKAAHMKESLDQVWCPARVMYAYMRVTWSKGPINVSLG